jgi:hypothetical protein
MNKKYNKYISYIVSDIKPPYLINMQEMYGLKDNEYGVVLSKVFNQPVRIDDNYVYDKNGNRIYWEDSNGTWVKYEYDDNGNEIYYEDSYGTWIKKEYDANDNRIYFENSDGGIIDRRYE